MINITHLIEENNNTSKLLINEIESDDIGRKLYIPCYFSLDNIEFYSAATMMDSGSDICIMQSTYYHRLFPKHTTEDLTGNLLKTPLSLTSYTNHPINILGIAELYTKFTIDGIPQSINMYIVNTDPKMKSKTPVIFSLAILSKFNIHMNFQIIGNISTPTLSIQRPIQKNIPSYYQTDYQLFICHGYINRLNPRQAEKVAFVIPPSSPFLPGDFVLITQDQIPYQDQKQIKIFPSTSNIERIENENIAFALVENLSNQIFRGIILSSIETCVKRYHIKKVTHKNVRRIQKLNLNLISECRPPYDLQISDKQIELKKSSIFKNSGIINNHLYSLNSSFPEHSPDLSNSSAINNDVDDLSKSLTEERHNVQETTQIFSEEEINKFHDPKYSIQLGFQPNLKETTKEDLEPKGISIPESLVETPADVILEKNYDPIIWPYVKHLFLEKYTSVVSRHSLDTGHISDTLGYYTVKLKPHATLPKMKKLYWMDPGSSSMMRDVLEFLVKTDVIGKASTSGGDLNEFASPAFLVRRANKNSAARLVVNFKMLNECLSLEPITLSNFDSILNQLRDAALFTSIDIKSAFNSLRLSPESRKLALFSTQWGSYFFKTLPTGLAASPNALSRFCEKMLHHIPKRDTRGNIEYDENNLPIMISSPLENVQVYYDDIIIYTSMKATYKESVKYHFLLVERVVQRLAFHQCKLEFSKAQFCRSKINFLGWHIQNNYLQADPKRIIKIQQSPFPANRKGMLSYLGLLNCLRSTLNFQVLKNIHLLTPLTSSKLIKYAPTDTQRQVFKELNDQLTKAPLYSKICLPGAQKILLTDSSSAGSSQYSCILAQLVPAKHPKITVPYYLHLDDVTHRIIFDLKLPVRPIPLRKSEQTDKDYLINLKIKHPPEHIYYEEDHLGYSNNKLNSLGISLKLMLFVYRCVTKYEDICFKIHDYIREHILYHQILNEEYNDDAEQMKAYMTGIKQGILKLDSKLYIIRALSMVLYRTCKVINPTEIYNGEQIISFNEGKEKPFFFFLLYKRNNEFFVRPTMLDTHSSYSLEKHTGSFEVILYHSKRIPDQYKSSKIFDLELFALMGSLAAVKKLVGYDELLVLTDNKTLYFLFHNTVIESSTKLERWGKKIIEEHGNMKLKFINSVSNPADYLSRQHQVTKPEFSRVGLPLYVDKLLDDYIPKDAIFTIQEWKEWVAKNPQFLKVQQKPTTEKQLKSLNTNKDYNPAVNNASFRAKMIPCKHLKPGNRLVPDDPDTELIAYYTNSRSTDAIDANYNYETCTHDHTFRTPKNTTNKDIDINANIDYSDPCNGDESCNHLYKHKPNSWVPREIAKLNDIPESDDSSPYISPDNSTEDDDESCEDQSNKNQEYLNQELKRFQKMYDYLQQHNITKKDVEPQQITDSTTAIYGSSDDDSEMPDLDAPESSGKTSPICPSPITASPPIPIPQRSKSMADLTSKDKDYTSLPRKRNKNKNKNKDPFMRTCKQIGIEGVAAIKANIREVKIGQQDDLPAAALGSGMNHDFAYRNALSIYNPIRTLEKILTRDHIISEQQDQYDEIYYKTLKSVNRQYIHKTTTYTIEVGLLYIQLKGKHTKIFLPDSLINKYVAMSHLLSNHQGAKSMIGNLMNYYHPLLQQKCIKFSKMCVACMLCNHPRRTEKLGAFPLDADVMETLHIDCAESLGIASKFSHLLIVKCIISNLMILIPMTALTSSEFLHIFMNTLYIFHPKALYLDNGALFVSRQTSRTLFLMGTQVIYSSAYTGLSHGNAENYVNTAKTIFRKILTIEPNYNWTLLPPILTLLHNTSKIAKSKYTPYEILFGTNNHLSTSFFQSNDLPKIHPYLKNEKIDLENKFTRMKEIYISHTQDIIQVRDARHSKVNKNKISKELFVGDIVFVRDRSKVQGSTRPLKSYFVNTPFIVLHLKPTTCLVKRIKDNTVLNRSKNDIKKYVKFDSEFDDVTEPVKVICEQDKHEITEQQMEDLLRVDNLDFEQFNLEDDDLEDETVKLVNELDDSPPPIEINKDDIKKQMLEDEDLSFPIAQTRSKMKRNIENKAKQLQQENEEAKKVTFEKPSQDTPVQETNK